MGEHIVDKLNNEPMKISHYLNSHDNDNKSSIILTFMTIPIHFSYVTMTSFPIAVVRRSQYRSIGDVGRAYETGTCQLSSEDCAVWSKQ